MEKFRSTASASNPFAAPPAPEPEETPNILDLFGKFSGVHILYGIPSKVGEGGGINKNMWEREKNIFFSFFRKIREQITSFFRSAGASKLCSCSCISCPSSCSAGLHISRINKGFRWPPTAVWKPFCKHAERWVGFFLPYEKMHLSCQFYCLGDLFCIGTQKDCRWMCVCVSYQN